MNADSSLVYWILCLFPAAFLTSLLVSLVPRAGLWFRTTPTGDQGLILGVLAVSLAVGVFGVRKPEFVILLALVTAAVGLQFWGPKRWHRERVYGAYFLPVKVNSVETLVRGVLIHTSWGGRLHVVSTPANRAVLEALTPPDRDAGAGA